MRDRPNNGLIDYELQTKCNQKNLARPALINEHTIDVAGLTSGQVAERAMENLTSEEPLLDYQYIKPPREQFYSWVFANGLR